MRPATPRIAQVVPRRHAQRSAYRVRTRSSVPIAYSRPFMAVSAIVGAPVSIRCQALAIGRSRQPERRQMPQLTGAGHGEEPVVDHGQPDDVRPEQPATSRHGDRAATGSR